MEQQVTQRNEVDDRFEPIEITKHRTIGDYQLVSSYILVVIHRKYSLS